MEILKRTSSKLYLVTVKSITGYYCHTPVHSQVNQPKFNQRRISSAKFLGELYNYRMVESAVIFRTLFSFISFGINQDGSPSSLDPPEHLFRIRLVCTLLDTCGQYFDRGSSKRKLDCFLIYFQACLLLMRLLSLSLGLDSLGRSSFLSARLHLNCC